MNRGSRNSGRGRRLGWLVVAFLAAAFVGSSIGCSHFPRTEYGERQMEGAEVVDVVFAPSQHGSGTSVAPIIGGNGGVAFGSVDVSVPEKYAVVFRCKHGKFIIEGGTGSTAQGLWGRFQKGDCVQVWYREVYKTIPAEGKKWLVDYDFRDASASQGACPKGGRG